jgi:DUF1016 N-terminal domain
MNFGLFVNTIQEAHSMLQQSALKSVNRHLTIRNQLIGFYIVEFEQNGENGAKYGEKILLELAKAINIGGLSKTFLRVNRQFYQVYPQIHQTVPDELQNNEIQGFTIIQIMSAQLRSLKASSLQVPLEKLISRLFFSHFVLLRSITEPLKHTFYEIDCMENWGFAKS